MILAKIYHLMYSKLTEELIMISYESGLLIECNLLVYNKINNCRSCNLCKDCIFSINCERCHNKRDKIGLVYKNKLLYRGYRVVPIGYCYIIEHKDDFTRCSA